MKLQVGLLYRDSRQAEANDLSAILGEFGPAGWETAGEVLDGSLAMAYRGDRITVEEDNEAQPLRYGPYILTFDGRLDNREEIAALIGLTEIRSTPDPEIIARACVQQGDKIFPRLIGEFAFSLWNRNEHELVLVRSVCGTRPLYYELQKGRLIWASNFAHLAKVANVETKVNEQYIFEFLVSTPNPTHCALENLSVVPPGTVLCFKNDAFVASIKLWKPHEVQPLHYGSDAEYEEHFRHHITQAVQVRMRARDPIFSELSGGLDSTAIVLLSDQILRDANTPSDPLRTLSCVYEGSETDESFFIRLVEEHRGIPSIYVAEGEQQLTIGLQNLEFTGPPNSMDVCPGRYRIFAAHMHQHHARVLLTGIGGDDIFCSDPDGTPLVADHLWNWHFVRMHKECQLWSRIMRIPYWQLLVKYVLPITLGRYIREDRQCRPLAHMPEWLYPGYPRDAFLPIWGWHSKESAHISPSRRFQQRRIELMFAAPCDAHVKEYGEVFVSNPYGHRPLVEFCLSVPLPQLLRDGNTRSLMRRALASVLPTKILRRQSKSSLDDALAKAIRKEWAQIGRIEQWEVCRRGYVDEKGLRRALEQVLSGLQGMVGMLAQIFALERWLRSLQHIHDGRQQQGRDRNGTRELSSVIPLVSDKVGPLSGERRTP